MRKVELLPTRDCDAGYAPDVIIAHRSRPSGNKCCFYSTSNSLPQTMKEILVEISTEQAYTFNKLPENHCQSFPDTCYYASTVTESFNSTFLLFY